MKDDGPAFPGWFQEDEGIHYHHGMSRRDWFAGMALTGILSRGGAKGEDGAEINAMDAFASADAMLKEAAK